MAEDKKNMTGAEAGEVEAKASTSAGADSASVARDDTPSPSAPTEKKRRTLKDRFKNPKFCITLGVVVVVIAVAGGAFWVWHEQPSFCNAMCHTPMDPYVATYNQESGVQGVDKWGNKVENTKSMLVVAHSVPKSQGGAEANCLSCHTPTIPQQVTEVVEWASGNMPLYSNAKYGAVLGERNTTQLGKWLNQEGDKFCMNENCHNMTRQDLVKSTQQYGTRNPHMAMHNQTRDCGSCHKAHRASVNTCSQCHDDAPIPEGWLTYDGAQEVANAD